MTAGTADRWIKYVRPDRAARQRSSTLDCDGALLRGVAGIATRLNIATFHRKNQLFIRISLKFRICRNICASNFADYKPLIIHDEYLHFFFQAQSSVWIVSIGKRANMRALIIQTDRVREQGKLFVESGEIFACTQPEATQLRTHSPKQSHDSPVV